MATPYESYVHINGQGPQDGAGAHHGEHPVALTL